MKILLLVVLLFPGVGFAASKADFEASAAKVAEEVKTRGNVVKARANQIALDGWVFLAPTVYEWGQTDKQMGFPPKWKHSEADGIATFQNTVNWMHHYIAEGLKSRGLQTAGTMFLLQEKWDLAPFGRTPPRTQMSNRQYPLEAQRMYVTDNQKEWLPQDFNKMNGQHKGWSGFIAVKVHGAWYYNGHVEIENNKVPVYDVGEWFEVTVCNAANNCQSQVIANGKPLLSQRFLPSVKTEDKALMDWVVTFNAKTTADTALGILDAMVRAKQ